MPAAERITVVVPTLGMSPHLDDCLAALRREGDPRELAVVVVAQGGSRPPIPQGIAVNLIRLAGNQGFAAATNLGWAAARGEYLATVNDDAVVEPGWLTTLTAVLDATPRAAAAQGAVVRLDRPGEADGAGIGWNRWWQAVQVGRGDPPPDLAAPTAEVFGVAATAALYRRRALVEVALGKAAGGAAFDPRLRSYYEDVELAGRLRAAGWSALAVPGARCRHAGSVTGDQLGRERLRLLYGNRHLVLARLLGRRYPTVLPRALTRDLLDLAGALLHGDAHRATGIVAGLGRAVARLPRFARAGAPAVPAPELARFRVG